jgi:hypothetical protein
MGEIGNIIVVIIIIFFYFIYLFIFFIFFFSSGATYLIRPTCKVGPLQFWSSWPFLAILAKLPPFKLKCIILKLTPGNFLKARGNPLGGWAGAQKPSHEKL